MTTPTSEARGSPFEVLLVALRLGLTSFGGPVAHLGYFHNEYVVRRRWLSEETYAEVVAIAQALPGPASSQTGIAVGMLRAGYLGGLMAWLGFTLPSALALIAFGYGVSEIGDVSDAGWLHGCKIAAVAIVALAVWSMARSLAPDRERATIAIAAAIVVLSWADGVRAGRRHRDRRRHRLARCSGPAPPAGRDAAARRSGATPALFALAVFFLLLAGCRSWRLRRTATRSTCSTASTAPASLVFGGGHVVLPLLRREVVPPGWVSQDEFLAGYGAAQAVPGPLFTFSAYLGAVMGPEPNGAPGGSSPSARSSCRRSC